ncbi:RxLR effector protein, partial [Phytophthora megakarya]
MRSLLFQALVLIILVVSYTTHTYADTNENNIDREHRHLQNDITTTLGTHQTIEADDEERSPRFQGLSKFKNIVRGNTKSAATIQKNPKVIKEVEKFTSNTAVINELKRYPTTIKRLESLKNKPVVLESIQKAPVGKSVKKVETYLYRGQPSSPPGVMFLLSLFLI